MRGLQHQRGLWGRWEPSNGDRKRPVLSALRYLVSRPLVLESSVCGLFSLPFITFSGPPSPPFSSGPSTPDKVPPPSAAPSLLSGLAGPFPVP